MRSETVRTTCPGRAGVDEGMALITVIMVMMLVSVLMVGFVAAVVADNKASGLDRDQTQAYAAAHAGLEKLTSDLSALFLTDFSPSPAQINALLVNKPTVPGFQYLEPDGTSGYKVTWDFTDPPNNPNGNPAPDPTMSGTITHGPYQGFKGLITPYNITVTARSSGGAEVRMKRTLQTIAVPVFQFGMFSENDLSFHAGSDFDFGGRVHTNGNLYVAQGGGTLTLSDRITAVREIIRTHLSNGWLGTTNDTYIGTVRVPTTIMANPANNIYRALARTEGSLVGTVGSAPMVGPPKTWTDLSVGTYKSNIRNGLTGAKRLDLPLVSQGAVPVDLVRRPAQNSAEDTAAPLIYQQRYFSKAALRILLSDTAADITNLPTVVAATAPVPLDDTATAAQLTVDATHPPIATSPGPLVASQTNGNTNANNATITLDAIPAFLKAPIIRVNNLPVAGVLCSFRTPTQFSGCAAGFAAAANGSTVSATVSSGAGTITVTTTLTAAIVANAGAVNVVSTAAFAPGHFWANTNPPQLVSCTGNDTAARFTGCTGNTVAIPDNTPISTNALSAAGTSLLNGFIKIEKQDVNGNWSDVTTEILNLGIASLNQAGTICNGGNDPYPTAIIRLQRLRDNGGGVCNYTNSLNSNNYWPNALYDTREGLQRDAAAANDIALGGVMHYVALDVRNLKRWFAGTIGATGSQAKNDNGYIVYFSDRRNNRNPTAAQCINGIAAPCESGEYGFEDVVNPAAANGVPDGVLQAGEDSGGLDANGKPVGNADGLGNGLLETYGQVPQNLPAGNAAPYNANARPWLTTVGGVAITAAHAMVNRPILFRRALKLINGSIVAGVTSLPPGFTVASENPVYVQGNYNSSNANPPTPAEVHVPAAILGDAVTVLSTAWTDAQSFRTPNTPGSRAAVTTGYRVAIVSGKNPTFLRPAGAVQDFGSDGGAHNFLRYLENWGGATLIYRGSIVSFFYSRQATGTYKCCTTVYGVPQRNYTFDTDFLTPSSLPPGTPMFRDINTLTFRQLLRPNQ